MSKIEWTESTWNPVVGCSPVSPGCLNCYAATMANRLHRMTLAGRNVPGYESPPLTDLRDDRQVFNGTVRCLEQRLGVPLKWREPRTIFVCSMSDLYHESVPTEFIDRVHAVMALCGQHTFQVLTKRPKRMAEHSLDEETPERVWRAAEAMSGGGVPDEWPLPNVWHGTSAEDQKRYLDRIGWLMATLSAVRFLSIEPLIGPVKLNLHKPVLTDILDAEDPGRTNRGVYPFTNVDAVTRRYHRLGWVIVGGESGRRARPCRAGWIGRIVDDCRAAGVPAFVKQLGANVWDRNDAGFDADEHVWAEGPMAGRTALPRAWPMAETEDDPGDRGYQGAPVRVRLRHPKGADMSEWPECLRVRQMPGEVVR